jgi:hypothetical protein
MLKYPKTKDEVAAAEVVDEVVAVKTNALAVVIVMINQEAIDAQVDALLVLETEVTDALATEKTDDLLSLQMLRIDQDALDDAINQV